MANSHTNTVDDSDSFFNNPMMHVNASHKFHYISKAVFVPGFSHEFLLPSIPEHAKLLMEPLNWEFGVRCDRPFHRLHQPQLGPIPKQISRKLAVSTDFFLEQQKFWDALPGVDPNPREDGDFTESRPLKRRFEPIREVLLAIFEVTKVLLLGPLDAAIMLVSLYKRVFEGLTWELVFSVFVALQIMRFLPGMEENVDGEVGIGWPIVKPLYILTIPSSNEITRAAVDSD